MYIYMYYLIFICVCVCFENLVSAIQKVHIWYTFGNLLNRLGF